MPPPQIPRRPIELPQAVQDRAFDAVLGVAVEYHLLLGVVLAGRVEQPQDAGVDQIVQIHMHRQILVHPDGDGFHQRQMVENDTISQRFLDLGLLSG